MKVRCKVALLFAVLGMLAVFPRSAQAQFLDLTVLNSNVTLRQGDTVTFNATLSNAPGNPTLFLTAANLNLDAPLVEDLTPFLDTPISLNQNESFTGPVFRVTAPVFTTPGLYTGLFSILGGPNLGDTNNITVAAPITLNVLAAPEPGVVFLVLSGMPCLLAIRRRL